MRERRPKRRDPLCAWLLPGCEVFVLAAILGLLLGMGVTAIGYGRIARQVEADAAGEATPVYGGALR